MEGATGKKTTMALLGSFAMAAAGVAVGVFVANWAYDYYKSTKIKA
jgi:hypothetical protein